MGRLEIFIVVALSYIAMMNSLAIDSSVEFAENLTETETSTSAFTTETPSEITTSNVFSTTEEIVTEEYDEFVINETDSRLFAATEITATGVYPYALHILSTTASGDRPCTATLLTEEYAITAASCVYDATAITVRAATVDGTGGTMRTATAIVHPNFYSNTFENDIALLQLSAIYPLGSTINTINIAYKGNTDESKDLPGKSMRIIAFGAIAANTATYSLNTQFMKVMTFSRCTTEMKKRYIKPPSNEDCLDTESGTTGGCNPADKGGIVTFKFDSDNTYTLAGILNYYYACSSKTPNLFTRIGPYWDWIRKYVQKYNNAG